MAPNSTSATLPIVASTGRRIERSERNIRGTRSGGDGDRGPDSETTSGLGLLLSRPDRGPRNPDSGSRNSPAGTWERERPDPVLSRGGRRRPFRGRFPGVLLGTAPGGAHGPIPSGAGATRN